MTVLGWAVLAVLAVSHGFQRLGPLGPVAVRRSAAVALAGGAGCVELVGEEVFDELLDAQSTPILVDFFAEW